MQITGWLLVAIFGSLGYWLINRKGWPITGILCIAAAGLCLMTTKQGAGFLAGIQIGTNGIFSGVSTAFHSN
jgi:hypothetical protein